MAKIIEIDSFNIKMTVAQATEKGKEFIEAVEIEKKQKNLSKIEATACRKALEEMNLED